jgi:hypothetical protein
LVVKVWVVAVFVYSTPPRMQPAGLCTAVTTAPVTGADVESESTRKKAPPGWPVITQTVLTPVEVAVTLSGPQVSTRLPLDAVVKVHTVTA